MEESVIYFLALWIIPSYDKFTSSEGNYVAARQMTSVVSSKHTFILRRQT